MRIELVLDRDRLRGWHVVLVERLARRPGRSVTVRWSTAAGEPLPSCVETMFALERIVHRIAEGPSLRTDPAVLASRVAGADWDPDVAIDLGAGSPSSGGRRWRLLFDGGGEGAAIAAILAGRLPLVALVDATTGEVVAAGRPGTETPHVIVGAFEDILARAATLVAAALDGGGARSGEPVHPPVTLDCREAARAGARSLARAALHRVYRLLYRSPHWRTGWRFVDGPGAIDLGRHPDGGWRALPDDGLRFYADPFPIEVAGRAWLFVEDLEHRTGRGVISAVAFDDRGPVGAPRPVLELPFHISYPCVFEHAGEVWMIPETSAAGRVDLYRATRFPGGWVREATLLDGLEASDATPFRHGGRWWMTATVRDGGSYSDALHLWSAPDLPGPWLPHPGNPVLVDVASARPAGHVVRLGGRLLRPVQDCRGGYGSALGIAEILRLDEDGFEQRVTGRLAPGPAWPGRRLHTLNRAGRLECIDGSRTSPRLWPARDERPAAPGVSPS